MQKLKLQEKMSGIKEYPELDSLSLSAKDKYKRRPRHVQVDPVEERESRHAPYIIHIHIQPHVIAFAFRQ